MVSLTITYIFVGVDDPCSFNLLHPRRLRDSLSYLHEMVYSNARLASHFGRRTFAPVNYSQYVGDCTASKFGPCGLLLMLSFVLVTLTINYILVGVDDACSCGLLHPRRLRYRPSYLHEMVCFNARLAWHYGRTSLRACILYPSELSR